jgi:hypothetical protein
LDLYGAYSDNTTKKIKSAGTIDFVTGTVIAPGLLISAMFDTEFRFDMIMASNDVVPVRDHILTIPLSKV